MRKFLSALSLPSLSTWTVVVIVATTSLVGFAVVTGDRYWMFFAGLLLAYSLFASSLDLLVGYAGLLAFSHAAFFGLGGYVLAITVVDYNVNLVVALIAVTVGAGVVGCLVGLLGARLRDIQFAIVMLAIGQLFWTVALQFRSLTGGDDGRVVRRADILPAALDDPAVFLVVSLVVAVGGLLLLRAVARSPFGLLLQATDAQEKRLPFMGYSIGVVRVIAMSISGVVAAWAGCLYVLQTQFVDPTMLYWTTTTTALVAILVGGTRTIVGGFIGTAFYLLLEDNLSSVTENWMLAVGIVLVLVILFAPGGLLGALSKKQVSHAMKVER